MSQKNIKIKVNSQVRQSSNGNINVRTTVNNGHSTKTITKTIRTK